MARMKKIDTTADVASSSGTIYVFSTMATDVKYVEWLRGGGDLPYEGRSILIKGGTGVANDRIVTPLGVCTQVSVEDLKVLEQDSVFQLHKKNGYITVQEVSADPEAVAADMNLADPSAPVTPSDYENAGEDTAKPQG